MPSVVNVINSALSKIGATRITSLTDGTVNANRASDIYELIRDDLLRSHPWNFATRRARLAQSGVKPVFGFTYQYALPSDFLRVVSVSDNDAGTGELVYKIENNETTGGSMILTDANQVYLRYVARITDPNLMSPDFLEAWAIRLAEELAIPLANSGSLHDKFERKASRKAAAARSADGQEDFPEQFPEGTWAGVRGGNRRW